MKDYDKDKYPTQATINNNSENKIKVRYNSKPAFLMNENHEIIERFSSLGLLAKHLGCSPKTLNKAIDNKSLFKGYYIK